MYSSFVFNYDWGFKNITSFFVTCFHCVIFFKFVMVDDAKMFS